MRQYPGLARPGAGDDKQRAARVGDGLYLGGVQALEEASSPSSAPGWGLSGPSVAHPDVLRPLERLALGHEGGRHHDFGLLEVLQAVVATGGHGRPERPEKV